MHEDLVDQHGEDFVPLSKAATLGQDFEILPRKAWELVQSWYGLEKSSPIIRRYAHNTVPGGVSEDISYELHPPIFTIRKVRKSPSSTDSSKPAVKIVGSRYESFVAFIEAAKKAAGIDLSNKVRIWRILTPAPTDQPQPSQPSGILTPDASPRNGSPVAPAPTQRPTLVMGVESFNGLAFGSERELVTGKDEKENETSNEDLTLADAGLTQDQIIVLEEHDEKGEYIADTTKAASKNKTSALVGKSNSNSGRSTPTGGPVTRGRKQNGKVRGHVGLTNLGNTCYMNSALQCLRSVEELSMYFLNNKWKDEVNVDNPIGFKGVIAKSYAGLLSSIYGLDNSSSVSPKDFKLKLGRANPMFSGYGQQDSQEFVSWLVDALHEDLNRIQKKPYRENPDSDDNTFRDPEAVKRLGEVYRENHRARNDSVAMDLFSGFYKNTMVCPDCEKVSITFDPYSQLTLQLPVEQSWSHTITYVPLFGKPVQIELDVDKNTTIKALKEFVGKRGGGVPANRIMASEVYSHKYYRHLDDASSIAESNIGARDDIYFYELEMAPSNWPAPKKKGSKYRVMLSQSSDEEIPETVSPLHDRVVFPMFHRIPSQSAYRATGQSMALWPSFIVLTREEAKDYDTILRKVLARIAGMTTRPILSELSGPDQSRPGSDVVLTTEEDASPNDPQVKDGSVEGEDMVEVTMTDAKDTPIAQANEVDEIPEVLRPGSYIHPEFRNLFEMKHTRKSSEIVTTGWSTVDYSKPLEPISKRIKIPPSREESVQSSAAGSETTSSDEDEDASQSTIVDADAAIDAANVSSDEEMQSIEPEAPEFARSGRQNKKKSKKARKHERKMERKHKNNKNFKNKKAGKMPDQPNYPDDPEDESDERLLRMGEALVLDWDSKAYDALFGATTADDPRGADAMKFIELLHDPELQEKKEKRAARRRHGINLDECFNESSKSEVLSEDNAWYCSRCKERRRATKTLEIWTVPDILIIHLKRFSGARNFRDKIEDLVDFPIEGLDLSGKVGFPENKDLTYDLFAVDNHFGGLGGGHYTATAQNFFDKQWYDYNDSIVSKCESGRKAVSRSAYLLFYRRRSPVPLGPPSLQQIVTADISNPDSDEDNDAEIRSRSPAGNGLRLGDSSRNGSSSAGAVAAGAVALRGGGYPRSAAANRPKNEVAAASPSDDEDELPAYGEDEGYADDVPYNTNTNIWEDTDQPAWSFNGLNSTGLGGRNNDSDDDGIPSDTGALGSEADGDLGDRLLEDFGDDGAVKSGWGGVGTPVTQQDDEVAEIRLVGDD
jgi:ubiquitin carboxyl-terminal hydrolase 4/11/15